MDEIDKPYEDYMKTIKYIVPEELINEDEKKLSYSNLRNTAPTIIKTETSTSEKDSSSPENYNVKESNKEKAKKSSDEERKLNIKKIKFGQHENFSFFESYAREIIFQVFDYHPMYFFGYSIKNKDLKDQSTEEEKDKKKTEKPKDESDKKIKKKKEKKENEQNIETHIKEDIRNETQNEIQNEKTKDDNKEVKLINEIRVEKNKKEDIKEIKEIKEENKSDKEPSNTQTFKINGDIDFLIPDLKPEELQKVFTKKGLAPFIFYGNINPDLNSDLLGEIKENVNTGERKHIKQLKKYTEIIELSKQNETIRKKFGFKNENQKILVYIFNSNYNEYLKRMLLNQSLSKKFLELNNTKEAQNLCDLYSKKYKKDENLIIRHDFIGEIINSNRPYIFIFLKDMMSLFSELRKKTKEEEKDEKKDDKDEKENKEDKVEGKIFDNKIEEINRNRNGEDFGKNKTNVSEKNKMEEITNGIKDMKKMLIILNIMLIVIIIILIFLIVK